MIMRPIISVLHIYFTQNLIERGALEKAAGESFRFQLFAIDLYTDIV